MAEILAHYSSTAEHKGDIDMDILTRLENLEHFVFALSEKIDRNKFYGDADTAGARQSISDITPYTATQTAYYGESEKVFYGVPQGNITVFWDNYNGDYAVERIADRIVVSFDALTDNATISIMIQ
jgi:hypothetical protein